MTDAYIGLGSNLGDRLANLRAAVRALREHVDVLAVSGVYETDPVGPPQPDYLNAVVKIGTTLAPRPLLTVLKGIEADLGRTEGERWGPRVIDLDLLLYGEERIDQDGLRVPHPAMHERAFVLVPLADVTSEPSVRGLLDRVGSDGVRLVEGARLSD